MASNGNGMAIPTLGKPTPPVRRSAGKRVSHRLFAKLRIEKGIPIPPEGPPAPETVADLVRSLKPTESILFPKSYRKGVYVYGHQCLGAGKYTVRKVKNGYRLWRVK